MSPSQALQEYPPLMISLVENTKGGYYHGGLDDVWVFSSALTEEEIGKVMNGKGNTLISEKSE